MRTNIKKYQQQQIQAKKVKSETAPRELIINKPALRTENNSGLSQGIKNRKYDKSRDEKL